MDGPLLDTIHTTYTIRNKLWKCEGKIILWDSFSILKQKICWKYVKRSCEPLRNCLLNSTTNPANFHWNWAGLALLSSRQILICSQDFFLFYVIIFIKSKNIFHKTLACTFSRLISDDIGSVYYLVITAVLDSLIINY